MGQSSAPMENSQFGWGGETLYMSSRLDWGTSACHFEYGRGRTSSLTIKSLATNIAFRDDTTYAHEIGSSPPPARPF